LEWEKEYDDLFNTPEALEAAFKDIEWNFDESNIKALFADRLDGVQEYRDYKHWLDYMNANVQETGGASDSVQAAAHFLYMVDQRDYFRPSKVRVIRRPVRVRSRSRRVRRAGRHVSRSFVTAGIDSGGGGDDGGGDGDGQSDCHEVAIGLSARGSFVVVSARFGGLSLNGRINTIATRKRALPAQERGARGGGRFFIPLWRWAA